MVKTSLLTQIEEKREELMKVVMHNGMTSTVTIEHSQQLDHLLLQYQRYLHSNSAN
ncbi:aspartyl-phosphate phosphatase Spo0E family protein [Bacillus pumilus]|uniref:aspartyl-phosphate phosphatase Spo0E family protein n=1 Tax=Bacillus pumilus TaxID=1408 RepID=UPI00248FD484|nr:aspartyl-phosphate phosphatase Spo0E family protein [Bacillus pumilus]